MRDFVFSQETVEEIRHERFHHPHPRVQRKMEVLWLKYQGFTHSDIATVADVSPRSVQRYLDEFERGGLELVRRVCWMGKRSELDEHQSSLEDYFLRKPPRSTQEAQQAIERLTGIRRGLTQVRSFLKKNST
jgi:transposase